MSRIVTISEHGRIGVVVTPHASYTTPLAGDEVALEGTNDYEVVPCAAGKTHLGRVIAVEAASGNKALQLTVDIGQSVLKEVDNNQVGAISPGDGVVFTGINSCREWLSVSDSALILDGVALNATPGSGAGELVHVVSQR